MEKFFGKTIYFSFLALFFITPFLVSTKSSELFEFPKMVFVYAITVLILGSWVGLILSQGQIVWRRSWLDVVLLLILISQFVSTIFTLDSYTSWFGYYSRFHGGFLSTLCYIIIAWAFINFAQKSWIKDIILVSLASASLVCLYAIGEHFGIDANFWVQDVQNRVFSTLGQPNWLAAFLITLLPFAYYYFLHPPKSFWPTVITLNLITATTSYFLTYFLTHNRFPISNGDFGIFIAIYAVLNAVTFYFAKKIQDKLHFFKKVNFAILIILLISSILFTKSRSGTLALFISSAVFWISYFLNNNLSFKKFSQKIFLLPIIFTILLLVIGSEWTPSLSKLQQKSFYKISNPLTNQKQIDKLPHSDMIISQSTDIRKVVWQGAVDVWKSKPLLGTGTETFAYSYYQYRPIEHNDLSEWDFLYNKAHNEYLNFLANNGLLGLAAILILTVAVIFLTVKSYWKKYSYFIVFLGLSLIWVGIFAKSMGQALVQKLIIYPPLLLPIGVSFVIASLVFYLIVKKYDLNQTKNSRYDTVFLASYLGIFITNFYGFSVVNVGLLSFIIPAFMVVNRQQFKETKIVLWQKNNDSYLRIIFILIGSLLFIISLIKIYNYFKADQNYNYAQILYDNNKLLQANTYIDQAIALNSNNANYYLQKSLLNANAAYASYYNDASDSAGLTHALILKTLDDSRKTLEKNSTHINIYKSLVRVYTTLGLIDPQYFYLAIQTMESAKNLSPTDPMITYNLGLLYQQSKDFPRAEINLKKTVELKPNYRQAWHELAQFYLKQNRIDEATKIWKFILENIDSQDKGSLEILEKLGEK